MVTVTQDGITVEAATTSLAMRALKKEKSKLERERLQESLNHAQATLAAECLASRKRIAEWQSQRELVGAPQ